MNKERDVPISEVYLHMSVAGKAKTVSQIMRSWRRRSMALAAVAAAAVLSSSPHAVADEVLKSASQEFKVLTVEIDLGSVRPARVTVPTGLYQLRLLNAAFIDPLHVTLTTKARDRMVIDRTLNRAAVRNRWFIQLPVGLYTLKVDNHPELTVDVVVTQN